VAGDEAAGGPQSVGGELCEGAFDHDCWKLWLVCAVRIVRMVDELMREL
jgi:hypothetical protein